MLSNGLKDVRLSRVSSNCPYKNDCLGLAHLSEAQIATVRKGKAAYEAAIERNKAREVIVDVAKLDQAIMTGRGVGRHWSSTPRLRCRSDSGITVVFSIGSERWAGTIFVNSDDAEKLGLIQNGKLSPRHDCDDDTLAAIIECCNDPTKAAAAYKEYVLNREKETTNVL